MKKNSPWVVCTCRVCGTEQNMIGKFYKKEEDKKKFKCTSCLINEIKKIGINKKNNVNSLTPEDLPI